MYEIISIDGGGTKTKGILYSDKGQILKKVEVGFSNPLVNYRETFINISKTMNLLLEGSKNIKICVLGISGTKEESIKNKLEKELKNKYKQKIILMTDLELAYYSHFTENDGILGIIGTGSSLITKSQDEFKMAGGWGHILQDYGSGYRLAIETIKVAVNEYEFGNRELSNKIKEFYSLKEFLNIKKIVYLENKKEVAKLTPNIFKWIESEEISKSTKIIIYDIVNKEINNISKQIINFYQINYRNNNKITEIILTGGLVINNDMYYNRIKDYIIKKLSDNITVNRLQLDPVYGGYNIGKRYIEGKY